MLHANSIIRAAGVARNISVLTVLLAASCASAFAATPVNTVSTQAVMKQLTAGAGGATVNAVSTGAVVTAAGDVLVPASGLKIPVPVSVAANVGKARIASAALGCTNPIGAVVCVATAAQIGHELLNQDTGFGRYRKCPDGLYSFICRETTSVAPTGYFWWASPAKYTPETACNYYVNNIHFSQDTGRPTNVTRNSDTSFNCYYDGSFMREMVRQGGDCPAGSNYNGATGACEIPSALVPVTHEEIATSLQRRMDADFEVNRRLVEAMRRDQAAAEAQGRQHPDEYKPIVPSTPVTVTAPPVTGPETTVKVESKPQTDGSTDTTTTKHRTTVTPQVSGSTVGDTVIKYPSQTTITQTTVNNVTNNTTTNTSVVNNPTPQEKAGEWPDDYAREETLQKVADALDTSTAPDMPDQKVIVDDAIQKGVDDLGTLRTDAENGIETDKSGFFSWVWTPPSGSCSPFSGNVHGYGISFDLCPTIANIQAVLGWLFAIFAAIEVYGQLFKRND